MSAPLPRPAAPVDIRLATPDLSIDRSPSPSPRIALSKPYTTSKPPQPIDLWLDANESPAPANGVLEALQTLRGDDVRRYPDITDLVRLIAGRFDVSPDRVLVGAGGDDVLDRLCRAMLDHDREAVMTTPTFSMIPRAVRCQGATPVEVPWDGGDFPVEPFLAAMTDRTAMAFIVTPNNPTGAVASGSAIAEIAARSPGVLIVVDLAYVEFADQDPTTDLLCFPNVVCVRTLSKAYGMAGLRVGYGLGSARVLDWARAISLPYAVSGPAIVAATRCLSLDPDSARGVFAQVARERCELADLLRTNGIRISDSGANFVFARTDNASRANWLAEGCAGLGIAIRRFTGPLTDALRITCPGQPAGMQRLSHAIASTLRPQAILFDMDGVLVDVSASYRSAIRLTAARFGISVTAEDIERMKLAGDANNDWVVTKRLLQAAGVEIPLAEVTAVFESLYQGSERTPGLKAAERPLVTRALLERLARRVPLGVVTGRPRRDAEYFLRESGLQACFSTVVAMEDAPIKPDPAPVLLALRQLGAARAWMIGDTPDDIIAARSAGLVPIGFTGGAIGREASLRTGLLTRGAARILDSLDELEELLR